MWRVNQEVALVCIDETAARESLIMRWINRDGWDWFLGFFYLLFSFIFLFFFFDSFVGGFRSGCGFRSVVCAVRGVSFVSWFGAMLSAWWGVGEAYIIIEESWNSKKSERERERVLFDDELSSVPIWWWRWWETQLQLIVLINPTLLTIKWIFFQV